MSYTTGTLTSATPTTALMSLITAQLTAHASWAFVHDAVDGAYTNSVWKCLGAGNDHGSDFYVAFMRTTASLATSTIIVKVAEEYDPGTLIAKRGCPATFATSSADSSRYGGSGFAFSSANWGAGSTLAPISSAFQYQIFVQKNAVAINANSIRPIYVGLFQPLWLGLHPTQEFPLAQLTIGAEASFTRCPGYSLVFATWHNGSAAPPFERMAGAIGAYNPLYQAEGVGSRLAVLNGSTAPISASIRGFAYNIAVFESPAVAVQTDTITVAGKVWTMIVDGTTAGYWMNTEAP